MHETGGPPGPDLKVRAWRAVVVRTPCGQRRHQLVTIVPAKRSA